MILASFLFVLATAAPTATPPPFTPPVDAIRAPDGLAMQVLTPGTGTKHPTDADLLKLRYILWKNDGKLIARVDPPRFAVLPLSKMIEGWRLSAMQMVEGETRRAWVPDTLSDHKLKDGESYVIDTELIELLASPATPADVAAPPADAITTPSGLAYKILTPGTGTDHPKKRGKVKVIYSGWTTNGQLFDTSVTTGEPAEFRLDAVIPGWTEGLQLMTVGEKARFWIPGKLAYGNDKTKPQGMLVFDIELVGIE